MMTYLLPFSLLFSHTKTWTKALTLLSGALLCHGGRTVCGALRMMGKSGEEAFATYHRILSHNAWSALKAARILLDLIGFQADPLRFRSLASAKGSSFAL